MGSKRSDGAKPCRRRLNLRLRTREPQRRNKGETRRSRDSQNFLMDRRLWPTQQSTSATTIGAQSTPPALSVNTAMINLRRSRSRCRYHTTVVILSRGICTGSQGMQDQPMHDVLSKVPLFVVPRQMSESGALLLLGHHFFIYGLAYLSVLDLWFNVSLYVLDLGCFCLLIVFCSVFYMIKFFFCGMAVDQDSSTESPSRETRLPLIDSRFER